MRLLSDELDRLAGSGMLPMHMPGHKRNPEYVREGFLRDVTEITGFDNLKAPSGILLNIEKDAARAYRAPQAFMSVNGATGLILAAILARAGSGGKFLIALNSHISVWHGIELAGSYIETLVPEDISMPFCGRIRPEDVEKALSSDSDIRTVIITSPTYEGVISDSGKIYEICKKHDAVLVVDESHGAHLGIDDFFGPMAEGDLIIKSLHKTLNSPTQTAIMLNMSDKVPGDEIRHALSLIETTSPSYVLMEGIENAVATLGTPKPFEEWEAGLELFNEECKDLKNLVIWDAPFKERSKIVILCDGHLTARILRERFRIEVEAVFDDYIIAMTGIGDTKESLGRFAQALKELDKELLLHEQTENREFLFEKPHMALSVRTAVWSEAEKMPADDAAGKVSADLLYAYPPGIPLLVPGEMITPGRIKAVKVFEGRLIDGSGRSYDGFIRCMP